MDLDSRLEELKSYENQVKLMQNMYNELQSKIEALEILNNRYSNKIKETQDELTTMNEKLSSILRDKEAIFDRLQSQLSINKELLKAKKARNTDHQQKKGIANSFWGYLTGSQTFADKKTLKFKDENRAYQTDSNGHAVSKVIQSERIDNQKALSDDTIVTITKPTYTEAVSLCDTNMAEKEADKDIIATDGPEEDDKRYLDDDDYNEILDMIDTNVNI